MSKGKAKSSDTAAATVRKSREIDLKPQSVTRVTEFAFTPVDDVTLLRYKDLGKRATMLVVNNKGDKDFTLEFKNVGGGGDHKIVCPAGEMSGVMPPMGGNFVAADGTVLVSVGANKETAVCVVRVGY